MSNVITAILQVSVLLLNCKVLSKRISFLVKSFQWELICSRSHLKALSQAAYLAGLLIGSFAFSSISDHFGRKIALFLSIAILVSTSFVESAEQNILDIKSLVFAYGQTARQDESFQDDVNDGRTLAPKSNMSPAFFLGYILINMSLNRTNSHHS